MVEFNFSTNVERAEFDRLVDEKVKNQLNSYTRTALAQSSGGEPETRNSLDNTNLSLIPTSGIIAFGGTALPKEFLWCDGSLVNKDKYRRLFDVLGPNRYGTDTADEFYLPDLRDRFPRGATTTSGNATTTNINSHTHGINATNVIFTGASSQNTNNVSLTHTHGVNGASTSSTGDHNHSTGNFGPSQNFNRAAGNAGCAGTGHTHGGFTNTVGGHNHNNNGANTGNPAGQPNPWNHSHTYTAAGNVAGTSDNATHIPAYVSVNYIIKF